MLKSIGFACFALVLSPALYFASPLIGQTNGKSKEPIAFVGHGAFFDSQGQEIEQTIEFIEKAQLWYIENSKDRMGSSRASYLKVESELVKGLSLDKREQLFAKQVAFNRALSAPRQSQFDSRTLGKLSAVEFALRKMLTTTAIKSVYFSTKSNSSGELIRRVDALDTRANAFLSVSAKALDGKGYVDECAAAGVPIPPPIGQITGTKAWTSQGVISGSDLFIVKGFPAEVRTYEDPNGVCYALPRYTDDTKSVVQIDGVICQSKTTSKVCYWDNSMKTKGFLFPSGTKIPIGYPDSTINPDGLYQAGGTELEGADGGVCTDCHGGENSFVVHPKVVFSNGTTWGALENSIPAFGPDFYKPIVSVNWPDNSVAEDDSNVPKACVGCHSQGSSAGRFPRLSVKLEGYCKRILPQAIERTMPPRAAGSLKGSPEILAFLKLCERPS